MLLQYCGHAHHRNYCCLLMLLWHYRRAYRRNCCCLQMLLRHYQPARKRKKRCRGVGLHTITTDRTVDRLRHLRESYPSCELDIDDKQFARADFEPRYARTQPGWYVLLHEPQVGILHYDISVRAGVSCTGVENTRATIALSTPMYRTLFFLSKWAKLWEQWLCTYLTSVKFVARAKCHVHYRCYRGIGTTPMAVQLLWFGRSCL